MLHLLFCGISKCTVKGATDLLELRPYKVTFVHSLCFQTVAQEFSTAGGFRNLCLMNGLSDPDLTFSCDNV